MKSGSLNFLEPSEPVMGLLYLFYHNKWVSVTTARRVLRSRMNERSTNMECSCGYVEYAVADSRKVVVLHLGCWARCWQLLTLQVTTLWTIHNCLRLGRIPLCNLSKGKGTRTGTVGGFLWMRSWTFKFHKMRGISWLAENLLASEEEFCFMEFLNEVRNTRNVGHVATCMVLRKISITKKFVSLQYSRWRKCLFMSFIRTLFDMVRLYCLVTISHLQTY